MKKISILLLFLGVLLLQGQTIAQSVVAQNGRLQVSGNRIVNQQGEAVHFAGPSLFWSNNGWGGEKFYNAGAINFVKDDWGATIIRAAMGVEGGGGFADDPASNKARVETVVDAAIAAGIYVIIDFHTHHAPDYQAQAKSFFGEMAQKYGSYDNVIFEIYNEPLQVSWGAHIKPYAEDVISAIRAHSQNLVIVGTPTWSQDVDHVIGNAINDSNTAYTLHFYAGTHFGSLRSKGDAAMNAGLALFVTEWGTVNADGNGGVNESSTTEWVNWMKANKLSHCNWALNDKAEGASALKSGSSTTGGWSDSDLTWSGSVVKNIIKSYGGGGGDDCPVSTLPSIQAEAFCESDGIQTEPCVEGGENVGYIDAGDWMGYRVNVPSAGTYTVSYRVASLNGGGELSLEQQGGSPVFGTLAIPSTGGWQNWVTISHQVQLSAGDQKIAIAAISGGWNINWLEISSGGNPNQFSLSTNTSGSGSVSLNPTGGNYDAGTIVTATATAAAGWHFVSWSGDASGTSAVTNVTMNANKSITAVFEEDGNGGSCDSPSPVAVSFSHTGSGEFCWVTSDNISYINSWNTDFLEINGVDYTNTWSNNLPARVNGNYYIHFKGSLGWSHFEAMGGTARTNNTVVDNQDLMAYPNPTENVLFVRGAQLPSQAQGIIYTILGEKILTVEVKQGSIDISKLKSGTYILHIGETRLKIMKK